MNTIKIHRVSGIIIAAFVAMHLFNHLVSLLGAEQHINVMTSLRFVYRNPVVEAALLSLVVLQTFTGLRQFFVTRKQVQSRADKLQRYSGLYLAFFLLFHTSAVLAGRYVLDLDTNFYFGVAGINTFPLNLFFVPYYTLAIVSFFAHLAAIHRKKMATHVFGLSPALQAKVILGIGILLVPIIFSGLTNQFRGVQIPSEYNIIVGK